MYSQTKLQASDAKSFAMKTIGEQAQAFRLSKGWTPQKMADEVGTSRQNINSLEAKGNRRPHYIAQLARVMGTTIDALEAGRGFPQEFAPVGDLSPSHTSEPAALYVIPPTPNPEHVIHEYSTGGRMGNSGLVLRDQPGMIKSWRVSADWMQKNVHRFTSIDKLAIVTGFGDSMQPMFNPGDPLLIDQGYTTVDIDGVYFFRIGNEGFVKRLQRIPTPEGGMIIRAKSANKEYDPFDIVGSMDFEVFGRVVKVWCGTDF